jgi:hypothetical protein
MHSLLRIALLLRLSSPAAHARAAEKTMTSDPQ